MKFWNFAPVKEGEEQAAELRISGDIIDDGSAWLYEWFGEPCASPNAFREELKQYDGLPLTVWIDSYGGDVAAASGMYNALKEHKGGITVKIDGKAMSAASIIAMAGDTVEMGPVSLMMIHNPLTSVEGYASDLRKSAEILDEVKEAIINAYQLKTGHSRKKICQMMDDETYMSAKTAIKEGFADRMMYTDTQSKDEISDICRMQIVNSAAESVRRILDFQKPDNTEKEAEKLLLLVDLI